MYTCLSIYMLVVEQCQYYIYIYIHEEVSRISRTRHHPTTWPVKSRIGNGRIRGKNCKNGFHNL